jgi:hypothetical protein
MIPTHKIAVKLFVTADTFEHSEFVPIFHHWIQAQDFPGHALIDVADYAHVRGGPGTVLVASEANIYMDRGEDRLGLLYVRKLPVTGADALPEIIHKVLIESAKAATKLEKDPALAGRLKFATNEISIRFNDRLAAPNTPENFTAAKSEIEPLVKKLFGPSANIENHNASPQALLDLHIKSAASPALSSLAL